jgi:serine/threonine protein kinase
MQNQLLIDELVDGRYKIIAPIGKGGFGSVYLADHIGMNRKAALKFIHVTDADDIELLTRFEREAKIIASLSHKNIVRCYSYGFWRNKLPYLALEYLEGKTLDELLVESGKIPWAQALAYGVEICSALTELHAHGVVHRDLKPQNVIVTSDGAVKLIDFGLVSIDGQRLTKTGAVVGSLLYISPEQAYGRKSTAASDIYSLGCMLYQLIAGNPPFISDVPGEILQLHASAEPVPLSHLATDLPPGLERVVMRSLQKDSSRRYASAADFASDMQAVLQNQTIDASPITSTVATAGHPYGKHSHGKKLTSLLVGVVIAGAASVFIYDKWADTSKAEAEKLTALGSQITDELNKSSLLVRAPKQTTFTIHGVEKIALLPENASEQAEFARCLKVFRQANARDFLHYDNAVAMAAGKAVSDDTRATLLLAQAGTWFGNELSADDCVKWLDESYLVLTHPIRQPALRKQLTELSVNLRLDYQLQLFGLIFSSLYEPIQNAGKDPIIEPSVAKSLEAVSTPLVSNVSLTQPPAGTRWAVALRIYAILLSGTGRADQAITFLKPFAESDKIGPENKVVLLEALSNAYTAAGDLRASLDTLHSVTALVAKSEHPTLPAVDCYLLLYARLRAAGQYTMARECVDLASKVAPSQQLLMDLDKDRFELYADQGRRREAMQLFAKMERTGAFEPTSNFYSKFSLSQRGMQLIRALQEIGEQSVAIAYCEKLLPCSKGLPDEPEYYITLAKLYRKTMQIEPLLALTKKAMDLPNQSEGQRKLFCEPFLELSVEHYGNKETSDLHRAAEQLIGGAPRREQWNLYRFLAQKASSVPGQELYAIQCAEKALALIPDRTRHPEMHNELAFCYIQVGRYDDAIKQYDLYAPDGKHTEFDRILYLANSLSNGKKRQQALTMRLKALALARTTQERYRSNYRQACDLIALKRYQEAAPFANVISSITANDIKSLTVQCLLMFHAGNREECRKYFAQMTHPQRKDWLIWIKADEPELYSYLVSVGDIPKGD